MSAYGWVRMALEVLGGINPGSYSGGIETDLSTPLPPAKPNPMLEEVRAKLKALRAKGEEEQKNNQSFDPADVHEYFSLREQERSLEKMQKEAADDRFQDDWAARVANNGKDHRRIYRLSLLRHWRHRRRARRGFGKTSGSDRH